MEIFVGIQYYQKSIVEECDQMLCCELHFLYTPIIEIYFYTPIFEMSSS